MKLTVFLPKLLLCALMLPLLAIAEDGEVYKWRDANGVMRYSDTLPTSNTKHEVVGKKKGAKIKTSSSAQAPLAPVEGDATVSMNKQKAALEKQFADKNKAAPLSKEEAAAKRAKDAEDLKKAEAQKKAETEIKAENCKNAKSRLATYSNGGRIAKTDEKGERTFLSDADIAKGKVEAQSDVDNHCS
ncbi:MAG: DUF4124 domain-containing protein [Methylophilaceae bacterium]